MQHDTNKNDDSFDDDLDFDDLDEDEPLDESWEDLEDLDSDLKADDVSAVRTVKPKSFVQKNFNMIVIAVVVVGGGLFLIPNLLKPSGAPAPSETAGASESLPPGLTEMGELETGKTPPMPTPINSMPEDAAQMAENDPVLTPMPDPSSSAPPLPDLAEEQPLDLQPAVDPVAPAPTEAPALEATTPPLPEPDIELAAAAPVEAAPVEPDPVLEAPAPADEIPEMTISVEGQSASEPPAAAAPSPEKSEKAQAMEAELGAANARIEDLQKQLADLEKAKKKSDEAASKARELAAATPPPAENRVAESEPPAPKTKPMKKTAPKKQVTAQPEKSQNTSNASAAKWVLRSAQTGKALIAPQGGNDFIRVTVGDTLPGLGKILSIGQENGRWVVKGSEGEVRQ